MSLLTFLAYLSMHWLIKYFKFMFKPNRIIKSIGIKISVAKVRKGRQGTRFFFPVSNRELNFVKETQKYIKKNKKNVFINQEY